MLIDFHFLGVFCNNCFEGVSHIFSMVLKCLKILIFKKLFLINHVVDYCKEFQLTSK
jgi:hypothetical protein